MLAARRDESLALEINFGNSAPYSLGVEEEFQLLHRESYELVSRVDSILAALGEDEREKHVKPELLQSVVEVSTRIARTAAEAIEDLAEMRRRVRDVAAESDALIASAGTHPFSRYEHQEVTDRPRYRELMEAMRWVAERELIFGLHIHIGVDSPDKAIACFNGLRTFLPEFLALSVSSPFWHGRTTGLASTRIKVFDAFPRSGLPPAFSSFEEFELLVDRGVRTNCFDDYTYIWWDLRPHPKYGTIEMRICDGQARIENVSGIVALAQALVATLGDAFEQGGRTPVEPVTLVGENKWRATRYGLDADLVDFENDTERSARDAVRSLLDRCEPAARELGCGDELECVEAILDGGTSADEQNRIYAETGSLLAVAQWIADETVRGL